MATRIPAIYANLKNYTTHDYTTDVLKGRKTIRTLSFYKHNMVRQPYT